MGSYFNYETDEPAKVNALFFYENDGRDIPAGTKVVASDSTILDDIAYFHVDPGQFHLNHIKTVEDFNKTFPVWAWGKGQIKLSGRELTELEELIINFVVTHSEMFTNIEDQSGNHYTPKPETQCGWWKLSYTGVDELDKCTEEHIGGLISKGYREGQIVQ